MFDTYYDRTEVETVAWRKWSDSGYGGKWSATHTVDPEDPNRTVCGRMIPDAGNGVEVDGDGPESPCKRCNR